MQLYCTRKSNPPQASNASPSYRSLQQFLRAVQESQRPYLSPTWGLFTGCTILQLFFSVPLNFTLLPLCYLLLSVLLSSLPSLTPLLIYLNLSLPQTEGGFSSPEGVHLSHKVELFTGFGSASVLDTDEHPHLYLELRVKPSHFPTSIEASGHIRLDQIY
jgi:hypothetical protein